MDVAWVWDHVCCSRTDQAGKKPGHEPARWGGSRSPREKGRPRRRVRRPGAARVPRKGCHFPAAERAGLLPQALVDTLQSTSQSGPHPKS